MAEETPMSPISEAVPPKANPLATPASAHAATLKLKPVVRQPAAGGSATPTQAGLKPGLKLPPRPGLATGLKLPPKVGATVTGLKPGVRLPTQSGLKPGIKLPTKPGIKLPAKPAVAAPTQAEVTPAAPAAAAPTAAPAAVKPEVKLPTQPGIKPGIKLPTQSGLKSGIKLPSRPVIRKPGSTVAAPSPLAGKPATIVAKPATQTQAAPAPAAAPVAEMTPVEMTPVADLTPVEEPPKAAAPASAAAPADASVVELKDVPKPEQPKPLEALKAVTQNLKSITSPIPQQAILRKTGIIADGEMTEAQKQAAKSKTARISLSDAMGVAPVKNEALPMKTIRIKRPVDIPGATNPTATAKPLAPTVVSEKPTDSQAETKPATAPAAAPATSFTQRKTLKISRPGGGAVRPSGKFGVKKPTTATATPAGDAATAPATGGEVADIPEMPSAPVAPVPVSAKELVPDVPKGVATLGVIVQFAACVAIAALVWLLYENAQLPVFCSGLGM